MTYLTDKYFIIGITLPLILFFIYKFYPHENGRSIPHDTYKELKNSSLTYKYGGGNTDTEIMVITDYQCEGCETIHKWIWPLIKNKIKEDEVKYYSLDAILPGHDGGLLASTYSYCLRKDNPYQARKFRISVYKGNLPWSNNAILSDSLDRLQRKIRKKSETLQHCIRKNKSNVKITNKKTLKKLNESGLNSVPTIIVDREVIEITDSRKELISIVKSKI